MWKIKHIFDGEYGCEELAEGQRPKVSVTLINEKEKAGDTNRITYFCFAFYKEMSICIFCVLIKDIMFSCTAEFILRESLTSFCGYS